LRQSGARLANLSINRPIASTHGAHQRLTNESCSASEKYAHGSVPITNTDEG
jgi:hypothetical protein